MAPPISLIADRGWAPFTVHATDFSPVDLAPRSVASNARAAAKLRPMRSGRRARDGSWRASFWNSVAVQKGGVATSGTEQGGVGAGPWPFAVVRANAEGHQASSRGRLVCPAGCRSGWHRPSVSSARADVHVVDRLVDRSRGGTSTTDTHVVHAAHRRFALLCLVYSVCLISQASTARTSSCCFHSSLPQRALPC